MTDPLPIDGNTAEDADFLTPNYSPSPASSLEFLEDDAVSVCSSSSSIEIIDYYSELENKACGHWNFEQKNGAANQSGQSSTIQIREDGAADQFGQDACTTQSEQNAKIPVNVEINLKEAISEKVSSTLMKQMEEIDLRRLQYCRFCVDPIVGHSRQDTAADKDFGFPAPSNNINCIYSALLPSSTILLSTNLPLSPKPLDQMDTAFQALQIENTSQDAAPFDAKKPTQDTNSLVINASAGVQPSPLTFKSDNCIKKQHCKRKAKDVGVDATQLVVDATRPTNDSTVTTKSSTTSSSNSTPSIIKNYQQHTNRNNHKATNTFKKAKPNGLAVFENFEQAGRKLYAFLYSIERDPEVVHQYQTELKRVETLMDMLDAKVGAKLYGIRRLDIQKERQKEKEKEDLEKLRKDLREKRNVESEKFEYDNIHFGVVKSNGFGTIMYEQPQALKPDTFTFGEVNTGTFTFGESSPNKPKTPAFKQAIVAESKKSKFDTFTFGDSKPDKPEISVFKRVSFVESEGYKQEAYDSDELTSKRTEPGRFVRRKSKEFLDRELELDAAQLSNDDGIPESITEDYVPMFKKASSDNEIFDQNSNVVTVSVDFDLTKKKQRAVATFERLANLSSPSPSSSSSSDDSSDSSSSSSAESSSEGSGSSDEEDEISRVMNKPSSVQSKDDEVFYDAH